MAEDNLNEIMENWDSMDIGELGTSLLERKTRLDKAAAKRAKRQDKIAKIMGGVLATQSIFAASANRQIKKLQDEKRFDEAAAKAQLGEINTVSGIYNVFDQMAKEAQTEMNEQNWQNIWDNSTPELRSTASSKIKPLIINELTQSGARSLIQDEGLTSRLAEDVLEDSIANLVKNRSRFEQAGRTLGTVPEGENLFAGLANMTLPEYQKAVIAARDAEMERVRKAATSGINPFSEYSQWRNIFGAVGLGEGTQEGNLFRSYNAEMLPMQEALRGINFTHNISTKLNELRKLPKYRISRWKQNLATKEGELIMTQIATNFSEIDSLQDQGTINTGIRSKRNYGPGSDLKKGSAWRGSPLYILQRELKQKRNVAILEDMQYKTGLLVMRLQDPEEAQFRKAFFNGENIDPTTDQRRIINAATAFVITNSVQDYMPMRDPVSFLGEKVFQAKYPQYKGKRESLWARKSGPFNLDVNNFKYNLSAVDSVLENTFKVEDGQFIAESGFSKKDPKDKLDLIKAEYDTILSRIDLSDGDKKLLTEKLVVDLDAKQFVTMGYEFAPGLTNSQIIDLFNMGLSVDEFLTRRMQSDMFKEDPYFKKIFED